MSRRSAIPLAHCNKCKGDTTHDVVCEQKEPWEYSSPCGSFSVDGINIYAVLKCRGCGTVHYSEKSGNSEDRDYETGEYDWAETRFPFRNHRSQPGWLAELGSDVANVLAEGYEAANAELTRSASMCVRAALDVCFTDIVGDIGGFQQKLDRLVADKRITPAQCEQFLHIIDLGNASAHRAHNPSMTEVLDLLECAESVLYSLVILPKKTASIGAATPKRSKQKLVDFKPKIVKS